MSESEFVVSNETGHQTQNRSLLQCLVELCQPCEVDSFVAIPGQGVDLNRVVEDAP